MRIGWDNLIDAATLTAGSQKASLPVQNLQSNPTSKKWHTAAGVSSSHFLADLGSAQACNLLMLAKSNLTASATIRVRASTSDATAESGDLLDTGAGSPLEGVDAGCDPNYGSVLVIFDASVTARYWRVDLADTGAADNLQIGRAFLGPAWQPTRGMLYGWGNAWGDESTVRRTDGGQDIVNERARRRQLQFRLSFMNEAEMYGNAFELARAQGITGSVVVVGAESGSYVSQQSLFGRVVLTQPLINETHNVFQTRYTIEERL